MSMTLSRREFIALSAAGLVTSSTRGVFAADSKTYAYVGAWTQGRFGVGGGGGITVFEVNQDGSLKLVSRTGPEFEDMNAGYLAISADGRYLYATEEVSDLNEEPGAGGGIFSFSINPEDGSLTFMNAQSSLGTNPSMIVIDDTGKLLLASNHGNLAVATRAIVVDGVPKVERVYDDATVTMLSINDDGTLAPACDVAILDRIGGVPGVASQRSPHAHSVAFDPSNNFVLVADKGANRLYSYRVNKATQSFEDSNYIDVAAGVAPRHSVFHSRVPYVFVSNESEASVSSFHFNQQSGEMTFVQTVPTVSPEGAEQTRPSDIKMHPNGQFVYTANRGHNSIAIHKIDESNGKLSLVEIVSSAGDTPRGITFDPTARFLMVANQESNEITTFMVDASTGKIAPTGASSQVLKPACIKFLQL